MPRELEATVLRGPTRPALIILGGWAGAGFIVGLLLVRLVHAGLSAPSYAQSLPSTLVFASDTGMVLNFIKPEKTAQFEATVARLGEALRKNKKPGRKEQAASWKVFRAAEPGAKESVLYVFTMDPAVKGADYTVSTILAEAFPTEVERLYKDYADTYATGQDVVNLTLVSAFGQ